MDRKEFPKPGSDKVQRLIHELETRQIKLEGPNSYRILSEQILEDYTIQLVEDQQGGYLLRKVSSDRKIVLISAPIHSDPSALAEAREHFPDFLPFGGVPVDAT